MGKFYHATNCFFKEGDTKSIKDYDEDFDKSHLHLCPQKQEINLLLDNQRPPEILLRRTKAIYLFENLAFCKSFAQAKGYKYVYEVIPIEPVYGPFPMAIVNRLYKSAVDCKKLIEEYWCPTRKWNIYEYLTSNIRIVKDYSKEGIAFQNDFSVDYDLAKSLFIKKILCEDDDSWPNIPRHGHL